MTKITFCSGFKMPSFEEFNAEYEAFCKKKNAKAKQPQKRMAKATN